MKKTILSLLLIIGSLAMIHAQIKSQVMDVIIETLKDFPVT